MSRSYSGAEDERGRRGVDSTPPMSGSARRAGRRVKALLRRAGLRPDLYKDLDIGQGTSFSLQNLDGIAPQLISIGRDCIIAPTAMILTHDASLLIHTGKYLVRPVTIGDEVFVGYGAVVMPGVTIGDRAIIGVRAVVTRNVPSGAIAAGVPARILSTIEELVAKQDASQLVEPPYPRTNRPSPAQVLALQRRILEKVRAVHSITRKHSTDEEPAH